MTTAASIERKVWTEAELEALPEDGYNHEVVDGELVISPKNNPYHGNICAELLMAMCAFAKAHRLGAVWDSRRGPTKTYLGSKPNIFGPLFRLNGRRQTAGFATVQLMVLTNQTMRKKI